MYLNYTQVYHYLEVKQPYAMRLDFRNRCTHLLRFSTHIVNNVHHIIIIRTTKRIGMVQWNRYHNNVNGQFGRHLVGQFLVNLATT